MKQKNGLLVNQLVKFILKGTPKRIDSSRVRWASKLTFYEMFNQVISKYKHSQKLSEITQQIEQLGSEIGNLKKNDSKEKVDKDLILAKLDCLKTQYSELLNNDIPQVDLQDFFEKNLEKDYTYSFVINSII